MALTKQPVDVSFAQGVNTKADPFRLSVGQFLDLQNSVFDKIGRLTKRNGFGYLPSLPDTTYTRLTTFSDGLIALGAQLAAYSSSAGTWTEQGTVRPGRIAALPIVRNSLNQSQADVAVDSNGLGCVAYTESSGTSTSYKVAVFDTATGQYALNPTAITPSSGSVTGSPRVFVLGNYFVVVFTATITATDHLQYIAIARSGLTITAAADLSATYSSASTVNFDGVVANDNLYVAWNASSSGGIKMTYLDATLTQHNVTTPDASHQATLMSVTADTSGSSPVIWAVYYDSATSAGYAVAVNQALSVVRSAVQFVSATTVANVTASATGQVATVLYEVTNAYSYDSAVPSNYVMKRTVPQSGSLGTAATLSRSVGLASKAFLVDGSSFVLAAYQSTYQPTYFLLDSSGQVASRFGYSNGGGYVTSGLPCVCVNDDVAQVAYLFKDLVAAVNKDTDVAAGTQTAGVYTQTGINLMSVTFDSSVPVAEIGGNLNLGGTTFLAYDGVAPTEQNFYLYPDSVEVTTATSSLTPTGTTTNGSRVLTSVSSTAGVGIGMSITGTNIPASTVVTGFTSNTVTLNKAATGSGSGITFTLTGNVSTAQTYYYQATYEWTDNTGRIFRSAPSVPVSIVTTTTTSRNTVYVPTLRLTGKSNVKIVLYRWSTAQQVYYQVTSLTQPTLNDTTTDYVTIVDALADATILGNSIIYTNGGVLENTAPPAAIAMTATSEGRLWLIDAEDPYTLWPSQLVVPRGPVEFSQYLTYRVSPVSPAGQAPGGPPQVVASMDDKLIVFRSNAISYVTGSGPDATGSGSTYSEPIFVTSPVSCANAASVALMPEGLMFESNKGIWLLGRDLSTTYVGAPVEAYTQYDVRLGVQPTVTSATVVPGTTQVRFTMSTGVTLVYDYLFKQWGVFRGVTPTSSAIYQNLHTLIDATGRAYQETPGVYLDGGSPVLLAFTTSWINLAGLQGYQRAYLFYLLATYLSPHKLVVSVAYDYNNSFVQQNTITPVNYVAPYGGDYVYGQSTPYGGPGSLEQWQVSLERQQCQAFLVSVQEQYDPTVGGSAGAGFTMSGLNLIVGVKKGWKPQAAAQQVG